MTLEGLPDRLRAVEARIAVAGGAGRVRIVAVTKGFGAEAVRAALAAGLPDVGENYAQELLAKAAELAAGGSAPPPRWHFLGRVQRRKVRGLAQVVELWHGIDREEVGAEIARHAPGARVLVQVAAWGEAQKGGVVPRDVPGLAERLAGQGLRVEGLMAIAPIGQVASARRGFAQVRGIADDLGLTECSMGMSDDFEAAVEEGATIVRLGRVLFGPRSSAAIVGN